MPDILNAVVDISHHNGNVNLVKAKAAGILGVLQKATQGQTGKDSKFQINRTKANDAGLMFGAYHFATGGNAVKQAQHFLDVVDNFDNTLLVLDFEPNLSPGGTTMSLAQARAFVLHIKEQTGRFPGLYSGHLIKQLLGNNTDDVLSQCWFWLAQYGPNAVVPPNWSTWTMWQYTDGVEGLPPHSVDGIGPCDRDKFNGTEDELRQLWLTNNQ